MKSVRLGFVLVTLILIISTNQALAATGIMPGSTASESAGDLSLVEALYPAVMPNNDDPFNDQTSSTSWLLAQSDQQESGAAEAEGQGEPPNPQCAAFAADPQANIGDVIKAGCKPTLAQMSALMDNPLGNVAMLFTQFDFYVKKDPESGREDTQYNYMGIAQFPKKLGKNWNLINRVIWNVGSLPLDQDKIDDGFGSVPPGEITPPPEGFPGSPLPIDIFSGRTTGFGDMMYVGLFSPQVPKKFDGGGIFAWGLGFDIGIPTASEDILGSGKWTAGPSLLGVYMGPKWKVGALVTHFKDFASRDKDRADVHLTNLQYFLFYSLSETTSVGAAPNIICNWEQDGDNTCTVPIGIGFSTTVQMGKVPVRFGAEFHYSVIKPDDVLGTKWDFRFYVIPAAPSALFDWMN